MRKLLTLTLILVTFGFNQVFAQWIGITSENPAKVKNELISSDVNTSRVNFTLEGFYKHKVETPNGLEYVVSTEGATPILKAGAPDVAKTTASVIIPDMDEMQVEVVSAKYKEFENISIAPSKGNLYRDVNPEDVPYEYGEEYEEDAFYPSEIATLRTPYILRDYRGQTVVVNPFRYNPVTQTLRVYYDVEVKITSTGNTGENAFNRTREFRTLETEFKNIYAQQFLNYGNDQRYTPVEEEGSILIIAYGDFMEAMQPYIDWKIMTGREVEMVDVAEIGGSSEIEAYIEDYYYDNDLAYCLLVGDADQVPTSYASGDSDNNYAYIEGGDSYPEIFMGRFSAESVDEVETQVQRTIEYEKEPYTEEEWYPNSTSISSNQGPGDDGEYDYEHLRNIQEDLNDFGYTYNYELFDGSQGGNDDNGNPTPADVAEVVNSGTTIINYTGHGSTTSWSSSGFSNSDVNNLVNDEKLPFIWSVACVNGNFVGNTCFAEAWLRATDSEDNPTGAIATMMSTINQSWNPPMRGQDEMNDILTEQYDDNIKRTFGGLSFNGCMGMNDEYGAEGDEMTDTWTLFGDPSVMVRTNNPTEISATHNPTIFLGSSSFTVNATDAEGATVAMTMDGEIYGTATIEDGSATVEFDDPVNDPGMMNLVITAFNKIPYIEELEAIPAEGPYVTLADFSLDNDADFGQTVNISVDLENVGIEPAEETTTTLATEDEYVTVTDDEEFAGTIEAEETITLEEAFEISIADSVPDQHVVTFVMTIVSGDEEWENQFNITLNAPVFNSGMLTINDDEGGNGNGRLDPGETVTITVPAMNEGHADAVSAQAHLNTSSGYATITNTIHNIGTLEAGETEETTFTLVCDEDTPAGTVIALNYDIVSGEYAYSEEYSATAGLILEDWESGTFDNFDWTFGGDAEWSVVEEPVYEGTHAVQSDEIDHDQSAEMHLEYEVMTDDSISFYRKVSSEANYDYLRFYIDDEEMGEWSGDVDWSRVAYPVSEGTHTFKWVYEKDNMVSSGDDCAWVDFIVLPPEMAMTASAGADMTVCDQEEVNLNGSATMYESVEWTTSGDGSFDDPTALQPVYSMGENDMEHGEVTLTIHVSGNGDEMTDDMTLTYNKMPEASMPEEMEVCADQELNLESVEAENYASVEWTTSGTGSFDDETVLNTIYHPSEEDAAAGSVVLMLTAHGMDACDDVAEEMTVNINTVPEVAAMPAGVEEPCAGAEEAYTVEAVEGAESYSWNVEPADAATIEENEESASITWDEAFAGEAAIEVVAANSCGESEASEPLSIAVMPKPAATFNSDVTEVDHAFTDTTAFSITDAVDYNNISCVAEPEEAISEMIEDGETAHMVWNDDYSGEVTVRFMLENDCGITEMEHSLMLKSTVGIGEGETYNASVFPNPNDGSFKLQLSADKTQNVNVRVMSPLGKVVYTNNNIQFNDRYETTIDIEHASNGVYYLVIEGDDARRVEKIIVK